jgi:hypothetical protein
MGKTKPRSRKPAAKASGDAGPKILLLGNGAAVPWWIERLEAARAPFYHMEREGQGSPPWTDPDLIIETEDLRFGDPTTAITKRTGTTTVPIGGNGNGHGHHPRPRSHARPCPRTRISSSPKAASSSRPATVPPRR